MATKEKPKSRLAALDVLCDGCSANARPWVRAGPVRAWSIDFEKKGADGRPVAGLWLCSKGAALYMAARHVAVGRGHFTLESAGTPVPLRCCCSLTT